MPSVLAQNAATWLTEFLADRRSETRRARYRHPDIKQAIRDETGWKCVYCESKLGHNTPGDIEHKIPSSKRPELHFAWANLTSACTECNRRKSNYYEVATEFLDPYSDDVEAQLLHLGPLVFWASGNTRAEVTVRTLELDSMGRAPLFERKLQTLHKARALLEGLDGVGPPILQALRRSEVDRMCDSMAEYSAAVLAYVQASGVGG